MNILNMILTDWLQQNIFYVVVGIILTFIIFILVCLIVKFYLVKVKQSKTGEEEKEEVKKEKKSKKKKDDGINEIFDNIIANVGGIENINEVSLKGSRLNFILKNNELVNSDALKEAGIAGIIVMTAKVTLVVGNEANELLTYINQKLEK